MAKKTQKGKSKVLLLAGVLVIIAAAGAFYLFTQKSGSMGIAIPGMKAPLNSSCKHNDPELCKFLNNWSAQQSYSVTSTSTFGGASIDSTYEISGTNKFHMTSKMNGVENSNVITIDDTTYTLDQKDKKWWKVTYKPEEMEEEKKNEIKNNFDFNEEEDTTTYKFIVKEACDSRTCFKYQIVSGEAEEMTQYIWFDDKEYLVRKMRIEDKENGASESTYSYENVNINVPSPVKEGSPSDDMTPNGYSEEDVKKMMQQYQQSNPSGDTEMPVDDTSADYE